jgi:hypothetical protein
MATDFAPSKFSTGLRIKVAINFPSRLEFPSYVTETE